MGGEKKNKKKSRRLTSSPAPFCRLLSERHGEKRGKCTLGFCWRLVRAKLYSAMNADEEVANAELELAKLYPAHPYVGVASVEDNVHGNLVTTGGGNCVGLSVELCNRIGVRTT